MDFPTSQPDVGLVGGVFVDENPATGQPGSRIPASWGNQVTQEIKAVIEAAAIIPSDQTSDQLVDAIQKLIAESTADTGGMPRFTAYLWTGRGDATPGGDTQSSGQPLLDLKYPTMRADVMASQFYCTEAEWQADPYKRVTHWSLGDGASWMRPPDKNGVQPGNVGAFYGVGANPATAKPGTAAIDAMRNIVGVMANINPIPGPGGVSGAFSSTASGASTSNAAGSASGTYHYTFNAANALPAGTTTDPVTGEFRPRTWYGIWMIRMYGRVVNTGLLDAPALNARMDMIDARLSAVESDHHQQYSVLSSRAMGVTYTNDTDRLRFLFLEGTAAAAGGSIKLLIDGKMWTGSSYPTAGLSTAVFAVVPPGKTYSAPTGHVSTMRTWIEVSA